MRHHGCVSFTARAALRNRDAFSPTKSKRPDASGFPGRIENGLALAGTQACRGVDFHQTFRRA